MGGCCGYCFFLFLGEHIDILPKCTDGVCSIVTILTVRQLTSFAFIKLHPHIYMDIYIQLLLLFSLCIYTKACRLQILTVIILGHSSLIHVFLSYSLFKIQFCANRTP